MKEESNDWRKILKKILRALKSALLSIFHMDYQIESQRNQKGGLKLKVSKVKLTFIILTISTIIWAIMVCYTTLRRYFYVTGIALLTTWMGFIAVAIEESLKRKKPTVSVRWRHLTA
ncbi:MAG: hypothetical protein OEY81_05900 [Candidatus Bathyarchaeota archaeon]|nr:hypothetical protein [Candidatus Bathyarchaeota archaeon]